MSNNFELLQQVEREREVFAPPTKAALSSHVIHRRLRLEAQTREEIAKLVQGVFPWLRPDSSRVVVFCAVDHGDGCSSICEWSAEVIAAREHGSACIVEANLQTPSLHENFTLKCSPGLTEAMQHTGPIREFAQQIPGKNLWVLTSGSAVRDSSTFFDDDRLRQRMKDLREQFDYVLIDAPPVNRYTVATTLGQLADGIVLVVQSDATRREAARRAIQTLQSAHVNVLGVVLNKRTYPIPQGLYDRL